MPKIPIVDFIAPTYHPINFQRSHLPLSEDTCQLGVGGSIEATSPALTILPGRIMTAVDVTELDGHLLLAAGTEQGDLLQASGIIKLLHSIINTVL